MHFDSELVRYLFYAIGIVAAVALLFAGYKLGRLTAGMSYRRSLDAREQELFTAQKGFKNLYEQELAQAKSEIAAQKKQLDQQAQRIEEYRRKAAGYGGLFSTGGKHADAMYALLLENEALEEALMTQNDKLRQERTDSLKEQMRATSYRRVLMSQILADDRVKGTVQQILSEERHLPAPEKQGDGAEGR